jgi:hypothetical protein
LLNIFDPLFNGLARVEFYRAQIIPDLFPNQKEMLIHNWSAQDREMFCGEGVAN